jgi:hypothetical protein
MATVQKARGSAAKIEPLWDRLQANIEWYDEKAKHNQRAYKASKIAVIVLAIAIPVLAEYGVVGEHDARALLVGLASGAILLLEGLQVLNKWQENWVLYRATCEGLRNEQHLFAEKAGPYAGLKPEVANRVLAERTSSLVMAEHSKWVHARAEKTETTTGT